MFVGYRLKESRLKKGLSQQQLGDLIGVTKVSICGYELGNRIPTIENFLSLIEILEVSADYLLGRDVYISTDNYQKAIAKEDISIIEEIKKCPKLYQMLYSDSKRTVELLDRKIGK